jgi:hypothetical protein
MLSDVRNAHKVMVGNLHKKRPTKFTHGTEYCSIRGFCDVGCDFRDRGIS